MVLAERAPSVESPRIVSPDAGTDDDVEVLVLDPGELEETINCTLDSAGCRLDQLREEARSGEFSSESNWRLWFCIAPFVESAT